MHHPHPPSVSSRLWHGAALGALAWALVACGGKAGTGSSGQYSLGGTVTGLAAGKQVTLSQSGTQFVTITANGSFGFPYALVPGINYSVSISSQPSGQTCTVANGSGRANGNVGNIAVTCTSAPSRYVYAVNANSDSISAYTIDSSTGLLSVLSTTPASTPANTSPSHGAISADGTTMFVLNPRLCCASTATVTVFSVDNSSGTLSFASSRAVGNTATGMAVDGTGTYVYVARSDGHLISGLALDRSTGLLSTLADTGLDFGATPLGLAADPSGKFVYSANSGNNSVTALRIGAGGALTMVGSSPTGASPRAVAVDPSGRFAYVANSGDNTLSAYRVNSTSGALTRVGVTNAGAAPYTLTVSPNGRWVVVASTSANSITVFDIHPTTGALTLNNSATLTAAPQALSVDSSSRYVYASTSTDNRVSLLDIHPTTGLLSFLGNYATGAAPAIVLVAPGR